MLAVCIAPGPSLESTDLSGLAGRSTFTIAINHAYLKVEQPDVVYACDGRYWDKYHGPIKAKHPNAALWTQDMLPGDMSAALRYGLLRLHNMDKGAAYLPGLCRVPGGVHGGGNGGYQAVNLAYHLGAKKILLVGYDMGNAADGKAHFFGEYEGRLAMPHRNFGLFIRNFETIKPEEYGIEIINCTPGSRLKCFPFSTLERELENECVPV
jgi:hypothetical protein